MTKTVEALKRINILIYHLLEELKGENPTKTQFSILQKSTDEIDEIIDNIDKTDS